MYIPCRKVVKAYHEDQPKVLSPSPFQSVFFFFISRSDTICVGILQLGFLLDKYIVDQPIDNVSADGRVGPRPEDHPRRGDDFERVEHLFGEYRYNPDS